MSTTEVPPKELKRLGFVHSAANYAHGYTVLADSIYRRVRSAVPAAVQPHLSKVEETVASYAVPAVTRAQDAGEKVLFFADDQVDYFVNKADAVVTTSKDTIVNTGNNAFKVHSNNAKAAKETADWYWNQVQQFTYWAADKLNPIKAGQAALEALNVGIEKAKAATDPDVAVQIAQDAWNKFASVPAVQKVLETADPVTKASLNSFYHLHDNIVSWGLYKKAFDTGMSTLSWASHTTPYKLGAQYVYPIVQPVADPALDKVTHSKVIKSTMDYWKPTVMAA